MSGKNTSKSTHKTKTGHMMQEVTVCNADWQDLERLSGHKFSSEERESIVHELSKWRDYRDYANDLPTNQDIKRTLTAISKLKGVRAIAAYENCDQITDMLIYEAAWQQFGKNLLQDHDKLFPLGLNIEQSLRIYPDLYKGVDLEQLGKDIAKSAKHVLDSPKYQYRREGRPEKGHHARLADYCRELWVECGNAHVATTWGGNPSPMVQFAAILFRLVDNVETSIFTIAERLNMDR